MTHMHIKSMLHNVIRIEGEQLLEVQNWKMRTCFAEANGL